jgi:hypothetical protein
MSGGLGNFSASLIVLTMSSGRPCMLMSHIPTQSGGAWNEMTGLSIYTPNEEIC